MSDEAVEALQAEWPPKVIAEWVRGGTVSDDALRAELRAWLAYWDLCAVRAPLRRPE